MKKSLCVPRALVEKGWGARLTSVDAAEAWGYLCMTTFLTLEPLDPGTLESSLMK
jgi:hypothetical protein